MRRLLLGLAGFLVIAFAASVCFAEGDEEKMEWSWKGWGQFRATIDDGTYNAARQKPEGGNENFQSLRFRMLPGGKYKWLEWGTQFELDSTLTLLDFWANITCPEYKGAVQLKFGQFIPPFGIERPASPYKLCTNYAQVISYLFGAADPLWPTWGNLRDKGAMFHGTKKFGEKQGDFQPNVYYGFGIFQGEGANVDVNSDPAWTSFVTLKVKPTKGFMVGMSYEDGSRSIAGVITPGTRNFNRDRFGLCWQFKMSELFIEGEYIVGNGNPLDTDRHDDETAPTTYWHLKKMNVDGWYLNVGYFLIPKKLRAIAKIDILDTPAWSGAVDSRGNEHDVHYRVKRQYGLGFVLIFNKHCKMKAFWQIQQNEGRAKIKRISGSEHSAFVVFGVSF